jgi:flagellar biogenesis protein FliO
MTRLLVVTVLLATVAVVLALRNRNGVATRSLKVTARAGLSRNAAIVVVEVEGRRLLIGAAANSVNVLAELGPSAATESDPTLPSPGESTAESELLVVPRSLVRTAPGGSTVVDRLRSMTTRSFAAEGRVNDPRGLA